MCPGLGECHQLLKGVQPQTVVPIVTQVCHEDADLEYRERITPPSLGPGVFCRCACASVRVCVCVYRVKKHREEQTFV